MFYRCGHQNTGSSDGHQNAAVLTADVINTHLASQVQQNAFMLWQNCMYMSPHRRVNVPDYIRVSQSACSEYALGGGGHVLRGCNICVVFVSDEWAIFGRLATSTAVHIAGRFPTMWHTMANALVMLLRNTTDKKQRGIVSYLTSEVDVRAIWSLFHCHNILYGCLSWPLQTKRNKCGMHGKTIVRRAWLHSEYQAVNAQRAEL